MKDLNIYLPGRAISVREITRPDFVEWWTAIRKEPHALLPDHPDAPDHMEYTNDVLDSSVSHFPQWIQGGVWHHDSMVGRINLYPFWNTKAAGLGYSIAARHRRQGFATAALEAVTTFAIDEPNLEELRIHISPSNEASQGVAQKAGFDFTGVEAGYLVFRHLTPSHAHDS